MRSLLYISTHIKPLLAGIVVAGLELKFLPNYQLIFYLGGAIIVDLFTGLLKSWDRKETTKEIGLRKTVLKIGVYICVILGTWLIASILATIYNKIDYTPLINLIIGLLSFIELYSVFDNIYAIAPNSALSRYIAKPFLKFLKGVIERADKNLNTYGNDEDSNTEG